MDISKIMDNLEKCKWKISEKMDNFWKNGQFLEKWTISGKMDNLDS